MKQSIFSLNFIISQSDITAPINSQRGVQHDLFQIE